MRVPIPIGCWLCPACGGYNAPALSRCGHCGAERVALTLRNDPPTPRAPGKTEKRIAANKAEKRERFITSQMPKKLPTGANNG